MLAALLAALQAATKVLWGDELITLSIAQTGSMAGIWRALTLGADPNPPLTHWLVLHSVRAFGSSALAVRLPSIVGMLLVLGAMWSILRRWLSPGFAAAGLLALMATRGFDYAYDARSYSALAAFTMIALALWLTANGRKAAPPTRAVRLASLAGLAIALALAISSNYYGVLAFFPIAAGELVRTLSKDPGEKRRRLRPGVWVAMAAASVSLAFYLPLIRHNIAEFAPHAWNSPQPGMIVQSYLLLVEGIFWPVAGMALYAFWKRFRRTGTQTASLLESWEAAALAALLLYPVLGFSIAMLGAGMISPRCVVPVCCGFGIALALLARMLFGGSSRAGVVLLAGLLFWVVARQVACAVLLQRQRIAFFALRDDLDRRAAAVPGSPILVGDSLVLLPLAHYADDGVRQRLVFPIDFDAIHRSEPDDSGERNLWAGRDGLFPVRIAPSSSALPAGPDALLLARPAGWLAQRLAIDGYRLTPLPHSDAPGDAGRPAGYGDLGGVFTPLMHEDTLLFAARR